MTVQILPHRLLEAVVMLPILHAPAGKLTVAAVGPMAEQMAAEALRWREIAKVYLLDKPKTLKDRRIEVISKLPAGTVQVLLLSPDQSPAPWTYTLAKDGMRLSRQYLPCLFTFGKDELPVAFCHRPAKMPASGGVP